MCHCVTILQFQAWATCAPPVYFKIVSGSSKLQLQALAIIILNYSTNGHSHLDLISDVYIYIYITGLEHLGTSVDPVDPPLQTSSAAALGDSRDTELWAKAVAVKSPRGQEVGCLPNIYEHLLRFVSVYEHLLTCIYIVFT